MRKVRKIRKNGFVDDEVSESMGERTARACQKRSRVSERYRHVQEVISPQ